MGVSTDGQLCYGLKLEEGFEFPWGDGCEEEWWIKETGFIPDFYPYNEIGDYKEGVEDEDPRIKEYYNQKKEWLWEHPIPFCLINYCSGDYPEYIVSTLSSYIYANRGYPIAIDPSLLVVDLHEKELLFDFCVKYLKIENPEFKWWLSSYWG